MYLNYFHPDKDSYCFRLKAIIEDVMPSAVERYNKECQRVAEEKLVVLSIFKEKKKTLLFNDDNYLRIFIYQPTCLLGDLSVLWVR